MKSIANQYRDLKEGRMSQANFMRNLRMTMPQHITNVTSFNDAVKILKNKRILNENINLEPEDEKEIKVDGEEEILALLDKIEQEKAGEEAIMSQYDPLEEALNKDIKLFGQDLDKRFKEAGFDTLVTMQVATPEQLKVVATNPNAALFEVSQTPETQMLVLRVNPKMESKAKSIVDKFQLSDYNGPVLKRGWTAKQVQGAMNPGDIVKQEEGRGVFYFYRFAKVDTKVKNVTEGKGKDLKPSQIHPQELRMGIKVEMEHTDDPEKAKKIALDHLAENPFYYTALKLSGIESPSKPKEKAKKEVKAKKKKESIQLVDLVNGMKKVKIPKTVKEAMEVDSKGSLVNTPDEENFIKRLQQSTGLLQSLSKINSAAELDGLFDAILNDATLSNISKQAIISALRKVLDQMKSSNWSSSKVANKIFSAPQQQALSKNLDKFKESLREMVREELAEYEKGDEGDGVPSKKTAAREITDKAVDYIDDYNEGESKEYKKKWLDNVFDSYEDKVGHRYDNDVFQDVIDMLKAKGYTMSMKETFDGRDNLIDPIAAIEK